ncbi:hypothetical protein VTO42DRAFT_550 [Malbranchea cinnamomea]
MVVGRGLALAQANGMRSLSWADLVDILTHPYCYEITWRNFTSVVLGIHPSAVANAAFGTHADGAPVVGSTFDLFTPGLGSASGLMKDAVQIGHIEKEEVKLTHPLLTGTVLRNMHFSIDAAAKPLGEYEPILMASGWATATSHCPDHPHERLPREKSTSSKLLRLMGYKRPRPAHQHAPQIHRRDIHGNPSYLANELRLSVLS